MCKAAPYLIIRKIVNVNPVDDGAPYQGLRPLLLTKSKSTSSMIPLTEDLNDFYAR